MNTDPSRRILRATYFSLLSPLALLAQSGSTDTVNVRQLVIDGDQYSQKLFDNEKALHTYLQALPLAPNDDGVLWRISRCYVDIGEHLPTASDADKQKQLETYEKSLDFAEKAVAANPKSSMAYVRRAIANGRIALFKGVWGALDLVKKTRMDCETAIELDSTNNVAYYVLGRTHAKVSEKPLIVRWPLGLSWASLDDAVKYYEKAIARRPDFIMYRLDCAKAYAEMDEYSKAREYLSLIATLPTNDEDDDQFRKEAKELLEKLKEK